MSICSVSKGYFPQNSHFSPKKMMWLEDDSLPVEMVPFEGDILIFRGDKLWWFILPNDV